ncbi:putative protein phosphatase 2C 55, partial [Cucurbita argyrosperma subsp. sororia]
MISTKRSSTPFATAPELRIDFGSSYIPKRNSFGPLGEDAHFISLSRNIFGVADGVGAWAEEGIDAGEYSRALMANCAAVAAEETDPRRILTEGYLKTKYIIGSSTACVIALRNNTLHAANIGDSGFMIFREKKLVFVSATQQHRFNCPYQLTGGFSLSLPVQPWECRVEVYAGDIIVAGTDGLLDNVFACEIEKILKEEERVDSGKLAWRLAELALSNSLDKRRTTPFSVGAREAGFLCDGGKIDDITVIVGEVQEAKAKYS